MSKKSILPQTRRHFHAYDEDWEWLVNWHAHDPRKRPFPAAVVRESLHKLVLKAKNVQVRALDANPHLPQPEVD